MHRYDYSFLKKSVPGNIVGLTDIISDLRTKEEFRKLQYSETFEILRHKAIVESVKGRLIGLCVDLESSWDNTMV